MKRYLPVAIALSLASSPALATTSPNLVANGDFTAPNCQGFTAAGAYSCNGAFEARYDGPGFFNTVTMSQTFSAQSGYDLILSANVDRGFSFFNITFNDVVFAQDLIFGSTSVMLNLGKALASNTLTFTVEQYPGDYDSGFGFETTIDNISATQPGAPASAVPEPATWGMMILGFGLVGVLMRRRKSNVRTTVRFA
jgi:hypothetical protein